MASAALWIALLLGGQPGPSEQVKQLVRRSVFEYDTGKYVQALADIERAYELDPRPGLLFNVGQCQRALGHHRDAALAYRSYLRDVPNAKNRAQVEMLLGEMEKLARQDEAAAAAAQAPKPSPVIVLPQTPAEPVLNPWASSSSLPAAPAGAVTAPQEGGHVPGGAWWLGGVGLGVALVGTVLFVVAESALGADHPTPLPGGGTEHQLTASAYDSAATLGTVGEVLWGVGGAALVGGGIWAGVGSSK